MAAARGTAERTLEWVDNNRGAGANRISRWTHQAGFGSFVQWCGVFLGSAMKAQGIQPPSGYPAAVNWSTFGRKVNSLSQARPGDILVYGEHHVAMYLGNGRQIQGNDENGTVGESGVGDSLGLGPITAIRRPPYRGHGRQVSGFEKSLIAQGKSPAEARKIAEAEGIKPGEPLPFEGTFEKNVGEPVNSAIETGADLTKSVVGVLENPESFLLTAGLVGGGAFLIYYGVALVFGVKNPVATPATAAAKTAVKGAEL